MNRLFSALAIAILALLPASSCFAARTASITFTITIPEYPLVAAVLPGCQFIVTTDQSVANCTATLLLAQPTLETDGWRLDLEVSGLQELASGATLPTQSLSISNLGELDVNAGQSIDPAGGPFLTQSTLLQPLDIARTVVSANPGYGNGKYATTLHFRLLVPEGTPAGTYVPNFTIGVSNNAI